MSQMAKVILKLLDNGLKSKVEEHVDGEQLGSRKIKRLVMQFLY